MNEVKQQLAVGDKVIVCKDGYGSLPEVDTVSRVTKTGQISISSAGMARFKNKGYLNNSGYKSATDDYRWKNANVYVYSDEKLRRLEEEYREKEDEQKQRKAAKEQRYRDELAETLAAFGGDVMAATRSPNPAVPGNCWTLPDGSRLYLVDLPIRPDRDDRKAGYEILIVRCKDVGPDHWKYGTMAKVESNASWINGKSCGFPSSSSTFHATDHDAILDAARYCYCDSW